MRGALLAVLMVSAQARAAPPSPASARAYVEGIYRALPRPGFDWRAVRYAPALAGLMRRDAAFSARSGDVGALDWVPFCECQDNDRNYAVLATRAIRTGDRAAAVRVTLRNGDVRHFRVDLVADRGRWLVADVHGPRTPSLLALLAREVPRAEASLRHPA